MKTKVKHILTIIGIFLGGSLLTSSASAIVTYEGHSDVQFTFAPLLTLTLSSTLTDCPTPYEDPTFCIEGLTPGTEALSNTVTATVNTNSSAGYTLSAKVAGTSLDGNHTFSNTDLISLSGHSDKFTMIDDTSSTSLAAGEWGFTLTGDAVSPATPTYMTLSDSTERIINATVDKSGTAATGYDGTNTTDMNIGAYADTTQKAGLYGNVINFTATSNIQMRTVTVAKNNNDVASVEINSVDGDTITPVTTGSWADGQALGISATCANNTIFLGWGLSGDFGSITNQDLASTTYNVGGNNVTLTAYCGSYIMQNITSSMCTSTPISVMDARDGQTYSIARLADNECWMLDNLNLGATNITTALTSDNTNILDVDTISAATFNAWRKTSGSETYTDGEFIPISGTDTVSGTKYGTLYNYCAASAGTYCYDPSDGINHGNLTTDLCPKGWKIPTTSEFTATATAYNNSVSEVHNPVSSNGAAFAFAGVFADSTPRDRQSTGEYWTATKYGNNSNGFVYRFSINPQVDLTAINLRHNGLSVRCILK
ncbi:hypothetical protein IKG07_03000 [Candidatus Saccharibacteria bacterium]|nr:hypothetical protein [Candidatus Saccharibacteria bacterium]